MTKLLRVLIEFTVLCHMAIAEFDWDGTGLKENATMVITGHRYILMQAGSLCHYVVIGRRVTYVHYFPPCHFISEKKRYRASNIIVCRIVHV